VHDTATPTAESIGGSFDHDAQPVRPVADSDHVDVGQADQQFAHSRSISFQAGAPRNSTTSNIAETCRAPVARQGSTPNHHPTLNAENRVVVSKRSPHELVQAVREALRPERWEGFHRLVERLRLNVPAATGARLREVYDIVLG
jgi:hypothetical protein